MAHRHENLGSHTPQARASLWTSWPESLPSHFPEGLVCGLWPHPLPSLPQPTSFQNFAPLYAEGQPQPSPSASCQPLAPALLRASEQSWRAF